MKMGMYKYISKLWQEKSQETRDSEKQRLVSFRKQPTMIRIDRPTRIDKARRLGYKAKQGFVIVRVKISKGKRKRRQIPKGRKPKRYGMFFTPAKNLRAIAEQRVNRKYPNMEVLNSYMIANDSVYNWYEIILIDRDHSAIITDKDVGRISIQRKRAFRGLTSAGKRSKGARRK